MHAISWLLWHSHLSKFNLGLRSSLDLATEADNALPNSLLVLERSLKNP